MLEEHKAVQTDRKLLKGVVFTLRRKPVTLVQKLEVLWNSLESPNYVYGKPCFLGRWQVMKSYTSKEKLSLACTEWCIMFNHEWSTCLPVTQWTYQCEVGQTVSSKWDDCFRDTPMTYQCEGGQWLYGIFLLFLLEELTALWWDSPTRRQWGREEKAHMSKNGIDTEKRAFRNHSAVTWHVWRVCCVCVVCAGLSERELKTHFSGRTA